MYGTCPHCGVYGNTYQTVIGGPICTHCGLRKDMLPDTLVYKNDKKLRNFALEAVDDAMRADRERLTALETRIEQEIVDRHAKAIKGERYDAWMTGLLEKFDTGALARELARRLP